MKPSDQPPSVYLKSQKYRHVDFVEFMNYNEIYDYNKHWVNDLEKGKQRVGYLYG